MKYCSNCGCEIKDDNQKFCEYCGATLSSYYNLDYNTFSTYNSENLLNKKYSMKWFKFLIYFSLFFGAFINVIWGISYITGIIYLSQTNGQVTAEMVYAMYGSSLKMVDVIFGIIMVAMAVFAIITRFKLAKFEQDGPKFLYILCIASVVMGLIYNMAVLLITGLNTFLDGSIIVNIFAAVIYVFLNYKYFSKRAVLFCN